MERSIKTRRREFLKMAGLGLAASGAGIARPLALAADVHGGHPLAPRPCWEPASVAAHSSHFWVGPTGWSPVPRSLRSSSRRSA